MNASRALAAVAHATLAGLANAQCYQANLDLYGVPDFDGAPGTINALLSVDGSLYAGGAFFRAGGVNAENVARWDGTRWSAMGDGVPGIVRDLIVAPTSDGATAVTAVGRCLIGDFVASPVSHWTGQSWTSDARLSGEAFDAHLYPATNSSLYLVGAFGIVNGTGAYTPSTFVRSGASSVDSIGLFGSAKRLVSIRFNNREHLVIGGSFDNVNGVTAQDLARYDGTTWAAFPAIPGVPRLAQVEALGRFPMVGTSTPSDQLWASGFTTGTHIWTPNPSVGTWQIAPGTAIGLGASVLYTDVRLGAASPTVTRMIAAGPNFNFAGIREIAAFDGSAWSALSDFPADAQVQSIYAIAAHAPTPTTNPPLYFAGTFDGLWRPPFAVFFEPLQRFNSIARFDGTTLTPLASNSMPGVTSPGVRGVAFNPTSEQLLAVGEFTQRDAQPLSQSLARWAGGQWHSPSGDIVGIVTRSVRFGEGFAISGQFTVRNNPSIQYTAFVGPDGVVSSTGSTSMTANTSLTSGVIDGVERLFANSGNAIRQWSPTGWTNLPTLGGTLRGISVAPDVVTGSGNTLYAFGLSVATTSRPLVRLFNNAWQIVGDTSMPTSSSVSSVLVAPTPNGPRLHAFGTFIANNQYNSVAILQPNGSWTFAGVGQGPLIRQAATITINGEPAIIAVGEFQRYAASTGPQFFYLAQLGQNGWEPWGPAINGPIMSMQVIDRPTGPCVVIAGSFTRVGQSHVHGLATLVPCSSCIADVDASGGIDATDLQMFMNHYERGEDAGDIDFSGGVDAADLAAFFSAYESGC